MFASALRAGDLRLVKAGTSKRAQPYGLRYLQRHGLPIAHFAVDGERFCLGLHREESPINGCPEGPNGKRPLSAESCS